MPNVFNIQRNDECICGSGKKYKKCCLSAVENVESNLMKEIGNTMGITAYGRNFIRVISIMYGIKFEEKDDKPDVKKLSALMIEAWEEEEELFDSSFFELNRKIIDILREKKELKNFRIPGVLLVQIEFDDIEQSETILDAIIEDFSMENNLLELAYLLRNFDYTEDEFKNILHWISMGLMDETYQSFIVPIFQASLLDIGEASDKAKQVIEDKGKEAQDVITFYNIYEEYPIFEEYLGSKMLQAIEDDLEYVLKEEIEFNFPFYIIYAFVLKLQIKLIEIFSQSKPYINEELLFSIPFFEAIDEILGEDMLFAEIYNCIMESLMETIETTEDEDLKNRLAKITEFFFMLTRVHLNVIENIFLITVKRYIESLPRKLDDSQIVLENIQQLISHEFCDKYITYLESKGLKEEAKYIKELYEEIDIEKSTDEKDPQE